MLVWVVAAGLAGASGPEITVEADGTVVAEVLVHAPEARVREILDDPVATAHLSPDVLDVELLGEPSERCQRMRIRTRGVLRPLRLLSRRCARDGVYTEELVASEDFQDYSAEWRLTPTEGGTRVRLRSRARVDLPIPEGAIERKQRRSVKQMLLELLRLTR